MILKDDRCGRVIKQEKRRTLSKNVLKRDGRAVPFDERKIKSVLNKAFKSVKEKGDVSKLSKQVRRKLIESDVITVELVQDMIEEVLLSNGLWNVFRSFVIYREKHKENRDLGSLLKPVSLIEDYLGGEDWEIKENSNMSYSVQGLNNYVVKKAVTGFWLNRIYDERIRECHRSGDFHIHDLDFLGAYCVGWDLEDLLISGFGGVPGKIESKPPKHFSSALGQVVNFLFTLQGESAGAQAFSSFDTYLAPFIRRDKLNEEEVKQFLQEFLFNMNVPTRTGFQSPFSNLTLDLKIPEFMKMKPIIIGGKFQKETYGDFQKEIYLLNNVFANLLMEGDKDGRPFTFPIPTYNIGKDFDWDNPEYDVIWKMAGKMGNPYFANYTNSDMKIEDTRSMCCRLRLSLKELRKRGGGLFGSNPLTGSLGVVTLNMGRIGAVSRSKEDYLERLGDLMNVAKDSLIIKRKVVEGLTEQGLFPYSKFYLRSVKQNSGAYWKNHFSTIGLVGMNESIINLLHAGIGSNRGREFAEDVLDFMRNRLVGYQKETGDVFNLEATPAEGCSHSLALKDKQYFGESNIKLQGKGDKVYYTNSSQLPVAFTDDLFEMLDLQDSLQVRYSGGTVIHLFLGESIADWSSVKLLVKRVVSHYKLPYFTLTPTFSICPTCGFIQGEHVECPRCKATCEVYSRSVGYLRPVNQWNNGKQQEFSDRKTLKI
ncbi:MAG: ribonucleoside triphosphate reductase [Nanoarchaeota archaeon]|nr:ribonucleoside triphosphate reductase [Nanoarchaeota archaeon]